jgi:hypothetical protein
MLPFAVFLQNDAYAGRKDPGFREEILMKNLGLIVTAALFLGGQSVVAAPVPSASVTMMQSDNGLIAHAASHKHKNMKKVHKAQGGGKM